MKFAVIAAGEGSRLIEEGIKTPKPLIEVGGEKLIDRLIRLFTENDASEIVVICNEQMREVRDHLQKIQLSGQIPLRIVVKSTLSSMHSLWEISSCLSDSPFVLTTVDTIFREQEFTRYLNEFKKLLSANSADGLMGVTSYIDDERPLYVSIGPSYHITDFLDDCAAPEYISAGIYGLQPSSLPTLRRCVERGERRMRNFQRALVRDGLRLKAWPFTKVLDIDHQSDIVKAERFLSE